MALTTILQTFDSSRYQDDRPLDRAIDIAHARSEALIAFLFGYDMIVPANDVADSPAFQTLIQEINVGARKPLKAYEKDHGVPLQLFKIGLESQYKRVSGYRGYSAFVYSYRKALEAERERNESNRKLVQLHEYAVEEVDRRDLVLGMIDSYLGQDTDFSKLLKKVQPSAHFHAHTLRSYFEPSVNTAVEFAYLDSNPFSEDQSKTFSKFMLSALRRARERGGNEERIRSIECAISEFMDSDLPKGSRANWRARDDIFAENSDIIRDWLDFCTYGTLFTHFGVNISSYFTQECDFDKDANDIRMGALSDRAFGTYDKPGDSSMLPRVDRVEWDQVIDFATSRPMREAIQRFHQNIAKAKAETGEDREIALEDAKQRHVDFLRSRDDGIYVEKYFDKTETERIEVKVRQPTTKKWLDPLKVFGKVLGNIGSISITPAVGNVATGLAPAAADMGAKIASPLGKTVDFLIRPSQQSIKDGQALVSGEMDRLNFWIR